MQQVQRLALVTTFSDDDVYDIVNALLMQAQAFRKDAEKVSHVLESTREVWREKSKHLIDLSQKVLGGRDITDLHVTDY